MKGTSKAINFRVCVCVFMSLMLYCFAACVGSLCCVKRNANNGIKLQCYEIRKREFCYYMIISFPCSTIPFARLSLYRPLSLISERKALFVEAMEGKSDKEQ